jgi:putative ABC transport system permease protein
MPQFGGSIRRASGLSIAIACTLAAGVAALALAFGVVDAALWREPPFDGAGQIAIVYTERVAPGGEVHSGRWSYARIQKLRESARSFAFIANFGPATINVSGGDGDPETVPAEIVSPQYFPMLRVAALRGRVFAPGDDDAPGGHPLVVIAYDLWQRRFSGSADIIGRSIRTNSVPLTVIGVAPRGFRGLTDRAELWIPTTMAPSLTYPEYLTTNLKFISVAARLAPGVTLAGATAELASVGPQINALIPPEGDAAGATLTAGAVSLNAARVDAGTRRSLYVLLGAVALLHLLACANVINLLLGRAAAKRREAALRAALGATTTRLVWHYGLETLVVAGAAGAVGVLLAALLSPLVSVPANVWFARNFFGSLGAFDSPVGGARTVMFGVAIAAATAVLAACAPAFGMVRLDPLAGLSVGARGATAGGGSLRRPSVRGAVVALETALAVLLVVAAGLMAESFVRMRSADLGIRADHLLTFWIRPSEVRVSQRDAPQFISRVLDAIAAVPGVVAASVDGGTPLSGSASSTLLVIGRPVPARLGDAPAIDRHYVAPDHFKTLGIPLVRGRAFTAADDAGRPHVAIISETAARRFWPGADPIGQRVWFGGGSSFDRPDSSAVIVGIVGDVTDEPLDGDVNRAIFYTPYKQFTYATRAVFVRTSADPASMTAAMRAAVKSVAPDLPLYDVQTMEARIGGSWARHRFDAGLFSVFGAVSLLLAAVGTFAVVSYAVTQRTREMGIRLALGARPENVLRLVVRQGLTFPVLGLAVGVAGALALTRLLRASLYEVGPTDLRVFGVTVAILLIVSVGACLVPAFRATRADPLEVLRAD